MEVLLEKTGTVKGLSQALDQVCSAPDTRGVMVLACDGNGFVPAQINPLMDRLTCPVFGGIFPRIIFEKSIFEKGCILVGLDRPVQVRTIPDLSSPEADYERALDEKLPGINGNGTMIVLVDGLARRINAFLESLFIVVGLDINFIGGGAGSLSMEQKPCLFSNQGMIQDGAVVALVDACCQVRISHGWKPLKGPFRVTESDRNRIYTLDWQPAFQVYQRVVSEHIGRRFTRETFLEIAQAYPFGITRLGEDLIVRDPVSCGPDQSLVCVGEVGQGAFVSILHGDRESLVASAARASASHCRGTGKGPEMILLMDCISRVLFLGEHFPEELAAVYDPGAPMAGACSIGEIASSQGEFLEFYNKTTVSAHIGQ